MDEWQPIDTAPDAVKARPGKCGDMGSLVQLGHKDAVWIGRHMPLAVSGFRFENEWHVVARDDKADNYYPTHWRPLSEPPR